MNQNEFENSVHNLVTQVINETDNEKREAMEKQLTEASAKPEYIHALFGLITNPQVIKPIRMYLCILLKGAADKSSTFTEEQGLMIVNRIVAILQSPAIDIEIKRDLSIALKLSLSQPAVRSSKTVIAMRKHLFELLKSIDLDECKDRIKDKHQVMCFLFCHKALSSSSTDVATQLMLSELNPMLLRFFSVVVEPLLTTLAGDMFSRTHISNEASQVACQDILDVLELYARAFKQMLHRAKKYAGTKKVKVEELAEAVRILQALFLTKIGNLNVHSINFIFEMTQFPELNRKLNIIQIKVIECLLIYLKAFLKLSTDRDLSSKQVKFSESQFRSINKLILESMYVFFSSQSFSPEALSENKRLDNLIRLCLKFLSTACSDFRFFEPFSQAKHLIFRDIILPNITTSRAEKQNFVDNPDEFLAYTFDFLEERKSKTLKITMINFFDNLCKYIDGMVTYVFHTLIDVLKFVIEGSQADQLETKYPSLKQIVGSNFWNLNHDEAKVETTLLMLTCFKDWVLPRKELTAIIESFQVSYGFPILAQSNSDLIKSRFILFSVYYLEAIHNGADGSSISKTLDICNWVLGQISGNDAKSKTAIKCFFILLKQKKSSDILNLMFSHLAEIFNNLIVDSDSAEFLLMIKILVFKHGNLYNDSPATFEALITRLIMRIVKEHSQQKANSNVIINSCFTILGAITCKDSLVLNFFDILDRSISSLLPYITNERVNWDEEVVEFYIAASAAAKRFSSNAEQIFALCSILQQNYNGKITLILPLINHMLAFSPHIFNNDKVKQILTIVKNCLMTPMTENQSEYYYADAYLLLQVTIQTVPQHFTAADVHDCLVFFESCYVQIHNTVNAHTIFLRDKVMGVLCSLLLKFSDLVMPSLTETHKLHGYLEYIRLNLHHFVTGYEIKLVITSMVTALRYVFSHNPPESQVIIVTLLDWLIPYMAINQMKGLIETYKNLAKKRQYKQEEIKAFNEYEELISLFPEIGLDEDRYFDDKDPINGEVLTALDIMGASEDRPKEEKRQLVMRIITPLQRHDEYLDLRNLVHYLKESNSSILYNLTMMLGPMAQKYFNQVAFKTQYVTIESEKKEPSRVLRKVVRLKAHN